MTPTEKPVDRLSHWVRSSVSLKLAIIAFISLLLLIPSSMIKNIIQEREHLNWQAVTEVSSKWAGRQQVSGPLLTIPLTYESIDQEERKIVTKYLHLLPQELNIKGAITPQRLRRGIYEVAVYSSSLGFNGSFEINPKIEQNGLLAVNYDAAFISVGISDLRGIEEEIQFNWDQGSLPVDAGVQLSGLFQSGITIAVPDLENSLNQKIDFDFNLNLQGSQNLNFIPLGNTTQVNIDSEWASPSFNGNFLPDQRSLSDDGFTAQWKILQLNRNFPQSWINNTHFQAVKDAAFGVELLLPLDDYQKSMRSVKYGIMTIALTFLTFFLIEILNKKKIHPFQYTLVGLALCLFYVLLVSISEHTSFNAAFLVSSSAIVSMITLYTATIFRKKKLTILLLAILVGVYGFLFVTLQMADYALLLGSMGLTLILAITMYFTRNINWYQVNTEA